VRTTTSPRQVAQAGFRVSLTGPCLRSRLVALS
jgi:hypothetical protein